LLRLSLRRPMRRLHAHTDIMVNWQHRASRGKCVGFMAELRKPASVPQIF
jgi:hypothetical protein